MKNRILDLFVLYCPILKPSYIALHIVAISKRRFGSHFMRYNFAKIFSRMGVFRAFSSTRLSFVYHEYLQRSFHRTLELLPILVKEPHRTSAWEWHQF